MGYDRIVYIRCHFSCGLDRKDACWLSFTPSQVHIAGRCMCHINWEICQYWASVLGGSWHKFKVPPTAAFRWRTKISMVSFSTPGCSVSYSRDFGGPAVEMVSFDQKPANLEISNGNSSKIFKNHIAYIVTHGSWHHTGVRKLSH